MAAIGSAVAKVAVTSEVEEERGVARGMGELKGGVTRGGKISRLSVENDGGGGGRGGRGGRLGIEVEGDGLSSTRRRSLTWAFDIMYEEED